jgi:hypothetical protein
LIAVKQLDRPLITFPLIIITIPCFRLIVVEIGLGFSLRTKAVLRPEIEAFDRDTDFDSSLKTLSFVVPGIVREDIREE